jgi:hypothetical protein
MILVLTLLSILGILGTALMTRHVQLDRRLRDAELEGRAQALARAGLEKARWALARDPAYRGEGPVPLGEGTYRVSVCGEAGAFRLVSEGRAGRKGRERTAVSESSR